MKQDGSNNYIINAKMDTIVGDQSGLLIGRLSSMLFMLGWQNYLIIHPFPLKSTNVTFLFSIKVNLI